ncbi:MAG: SUMF1/EgtB/PvdO family nonheme iron enzyme [bacterium]|nr:SUMF1/EgtB/PvdO family nonheme iron enzyme [bacterium]
MSLSPAFAALSRRAALALTTCALALACATARAAAPVVTSVTAEQQPLPSTLVDIHYTLQDAGGSPLAVMVEVSTNAGLVFNVPAPHCSGDVGDIVSTGANKHIVWDALLDLPQFASSAVRVRVIAFDGTLTPAADPDLQLRAAWRGANTNIVLEWDLQSLAGVDNLQFSPFYCSVSEITAAQYCRFLNAWKARFAIKTAPACVVTSVMNNAQGSPLVDVAAPGTWQLSAIRAAANTDDNNAYSKIAWDGAAYVFNTASNETNEPHTEVSWFGAVAYCQWLNESEFGANPALWKYRLPTEWEYEFLMGARGYIPRGTTQDWGSASYIFGQSYDTASRTDFAWDYVNYGTNGWYQGVVVTGAKGGPGINARNVFGMCDLSGNVVAWCLDWWSASVTPAGCNFVNRNQDASVTRSVRGGHWTFSASLCDVGTYRFAGNPTALNSRFGFVVVRDR